MLPLSTTNTYTAVTATIITVFVLWTKATQTLPPELIHHLHLMAMVCVSMIEISLKFVFIFIFINYFYFAGRGLKPVSFQPFSEPWKHFRRKSGSWNQRKFRLKVFPHPIPFEIFALFLLFSLANFRQLQSKTKAFKDLISQHHLQESSSGAPNNFSAKRPQDNLHLESDTDNMHISQQHPESPVPNSIAADQHHQCFSSSKKAERIKQPSFHESSFPVEHYTSSSQLQSSQSRHQVHHDRAQSFRRSGCSQSLGESVRQGHAQSIVRSENSQSNRETVSFEPSSSTNFDEALQRGPHHPATQQGSISPAETDNVRFNDSRHQQSHLPSQNPMIREPYRSNTASAANGSTNVDGSTHLRAPHHDLRIESEGHWSYQTGREPILLNPEGSLLDFTHVPSSTDHRVGDTLPYPAHDFASRKPSTTSDLHQYSKTGNSSKTVQRSNFHSSGRMVPGSPNPVQLDHAEDQTPTMNSTQPDRKPKPKNRKFLEKVASSTQRLVRSPTRYEHARAPETNVCFSIWSPWTHQIYPETTIPWSNICSEYGPDFNVWSRDDWGLIHG